MKRVSTIIIVAIAFFATSFQTATAQCTAPTGLGAAVIDATTMNLFWTAVAGATSYDINVQNGPGNPVVMDVTTNNIAGPTFMVEGLTAGSSYKFKVRTDCGGDHSGWSPYFFFTAGGGVGGDVCDVPTGLAATGITATGAMLTWSAADGAFAYRIRVEDGSGNPVEFAFTGSSATTSFNMTGLTAASNYKFKVRSRCASGTSGWSAWTNFTTSPLRTAEMEDQSLLVYPNPASTNMNIRLNGVEGVSHLMIVDLSGRIVYDQMIDVDGQSSFTISTADFANGIYQLMMETNGEMASQKFSVVH